MKTLLNVFCLKGGLSVCLLTICVSVFSSHQFGGHLELVVDNSAPNTYQIRLTTYTDPTPGGVDRCAANIFIYDLIAQQGIAVLADIPRNNGPISGAVPIDCPLSSGTFRTGVNITSNFKLNIYETVYTFPGPGRYMIYHTDFARRGNVINVNNSENADFIVSSELFIPTSGALDNPPVFLNQGLEIICEGKPYLHLPGGFDPDGDSLFYELLPAQGFASGAPVSNMNPFPLSGFLFPDDPSFNNSPFSINSLTGMLSWDSAPIMPSEYVVRYRVTSFRQGVKMSSIDREIGILVVGCQNTPPIIESQDSAYVILGDTLELSFKVWEPDDTDSLYIGLNTGVYGANGPFSSLALTTPTIEGTWIDGTTGQTTLFSSLPASRANQFGQPVDTALITITWQVSVAVQPTVLELDLFAEDNRGYAFTFPSLFSITRGFAASTIFIGYPKPNFVQIGGGGGGGGGGGSSNLVTLSWSNPVGDSATAFNVWYQTLSDDGFLGEYDCFKTPQEAGYQFLGQVDSAGVNEFIHSPPTGLLDTTICYLVTAVYGDPAEPRAESCGSQACLENWTTSIKRPTDFHVEITPNPSDGIFAIHSHERILWDQSVVYSLTGEILLNSLPPNGILDMSEYPAGIYLLKVSSASAETYQRIIRL